MRKKARKIRQSPVYSSLNAITHNNIIVYVSNKSTCWIVYNISNLFYFETTLYMFRTDFPSIIRSLRLYIQHQVYVIMVLWLLASKQPQNLYGMVLYVQS
jgi:hypothetical protein